MKTSKNNTKREARIVGTLCTLATLLISCCWFHILANGPKPADYIPPSFGMEVIVFLFVFGFTGAFFFLPFALAYGEEL